MGSDANGRELILFEGVRVRYLTALTMEQVLNNLSAQIGHNIPFDQLVTLAHDRVAYEISVKKHLGPSGFLSVSKMEYTGWVAKYGIKRKIIRWIIGNPLFAIKIVKEDQSATLFVPVEILITEESDGRETSVTYILPSSLIAPGGSPQATLAAKDLDSKLESLVAQSVKE